MTPTVGFVGVGTIAAATARGLRAAWPGMRMILSPRSDATSRALANSDRLMRRVDANADVVGGSDVVLLCVLPTQLDAVVRDLRFRPDQVVVSCVAGAPLADVAALVAPARACRLVPLPMIERREGPIVLYPALPEIQALFANLGDLVCPEDEGDFATYAAGSAMMSTFFELEGAIAGWMSAQGAVPSSAATYVRSLFRALAETGARAGPASSPTLVEGHETPGGLNARVRRSLAIQGWFDAPGATLAELRRLRRSDLGGQRGA